MTKHTRRDFLEQSMFAAAAAAVAGGVPRTFAADQPKQSTSPNEKLRVACVGVNSRGREHLEAVSARKDCDIVAIVDVDEAVGNREIEKMKKRNRPAPKFFQDIRKMLEDKEIDVVTIATPNHWHSLAAIWAIQHGKDVYVEKPVSHNVSEGRRVVQAARKHGKIVQTGTQCRSMGGSREAIDFVKSGKIGDVKLARGLCYKRRGPIGPKGKYDVPKTVNYDLWLGPAPEKPLTRRSLHYDWHWMWDYGNGDLGNQGIHQMDIARWGLGVDGIGESVLSYGGRLGYEDAGETANTQVSVHQYPDGKRIVFEVRGLKTSALRGATVGVIFHGSEGDVVLNDYTGGAAFDRKGNEIARFSEDGDHFANFVKAIHSRKHSDLNADILEGHYSSALCHLGNISYRLGELVDGKQAAERLAADKETSETFERFNQHLVSNSVMIGDAKIVRFGPKLTVDSQHEMFTGPRASDANAMLTREYRAPYVVPSEKDV